VPGSGARVVKPAPYTSRRWTAATARHRRPGGAGPAGGTLRN